MNRPFAPSCERNREPILNILKKYLQRGRLLEVGSGTGQHAIYFAKHFPDLTWVCSDMPENHPGIDCWLSEEKNSNIEGPKTFKIGVDDFPRNEVYQYVFTANTLHIMSWHEVIALIKLLGENLNEGALVFFYGPFNYNGEYTSKSNRDFDVWLKNKHSEKSAIRNFEEIHSLMEKHDFQLVNDHEMPANNRLLVFESRKK